jgi:hypothetical protein
MLDEVDDDLVVSPYDPLGEVLRPELMYALAGGRTIRR